MDPLDVLLTVMECGREKYAVGAEWHRNPSVIFRFQLDALNAYKREDFADLEEFKAYLLRPEFSREEALKRAGLFGKVL